ncbi:MAG: NUDIX hydrolase, partial [Candidatus Dormibacteria bacterium]
MAWVTVDGVAWPVRGAQVAIVQDGRVLVQLRPWPPGWELPGGHCEAGEDPRTAATREAEEETGHAVRITGLVGVYSWSGLRSVGDAVYLAEITGGRRRWS